VIEVRKKTQKIQDWISLTKEEKKKSQDFRVRGKSAGEAQK